MDETTYIKLIVAQVASLRFAANEALPEGHRVLAVLDTALTDLRATLRVVPEGFADADTYNTFLREQVEQVFEGQDFDTVADAITDVVGTVQAPDGTLVEVGNIDASVERANEQIAAYEAETGEVVETDNAITVTYTRVDGNPLSDDDVRTIINHPYSDGLKHLGNIQLVDIEATDDHAVKRAVFAVLVEGKVALKTLAMGAVAYRGVQVFPGLGRVQATSDVNFA